MIQLPARRLPLFAGDASYFAAMNAGCQQSFAMRWLFNFI